MDQNPENAPPSQRDSAPTCWDGIFTWVLWLGFFVLVVYPLSTGPVFRLEMAGRLPEHTCEFIYAPMTPLLERAKPVCDLLHWYIYVVWRAPVPDMHTLPHG